MSYRTRFAPSPTGYLHVGGARTALYCWLQARKERGVFVLRIEDTDRERSTDEAVRAIIESMQWLNLEADEGPVYQTHRFDRYKEVIKKLLDQGDAYHCYCSREELDEMREAQMEAKLKPRYDGRCRHRTDLPEGITPVVRFKTPDDGKVEFKDAVRGSIQVDNNELDDLIICRSDGTPTYNLTVVVDDIDMDITQVIRGDDHINNTPRQINLYRALSAKVPEFAHVPMILGEDGARLSKRHGAVGVMEYQKMGILPEALLNYLVRLGWSHGDQEIFTIEEMVELFDITDVNRSPSTFNHEKLLWINQQHMKNAPTERLAELLASALEDQGVEFSAGPPLANVIEAYRERAQTVVELANSTAYLFADRIEFDEGAAKKHLRPVATAPMAALAERLDAIDDWTAKTLGEAVTQVLQEQDLKMPKLAQPLRVALTGAAMSPSIDITLELVGKPKTQQRIQQALAFMRARSAL